MQEFSELLGQGSKNAWVFIPSALLLGALHGLEPGHSKTMMAAFIIAVRGTVTQAVLLGLSAAFSHSAVVWIVVMAGLHFKENGSGAIPEPYFQIASGIIMSGVAIWMLLRTHRVYHHGSHSKKYHHAHSDGDLADSRDCDANPLAPLKYEDSHAKAHARHIERRFTGRDVTTGQIILFGLTGGLIPCPAAITVLLFCLQTKQSGLGFSLVLSFSMGLALTMVAAGVVAALGTRQVEARWSGFSEFASRAPSFSGALIVAFGLFLTYQGVCALLQI